MRLTLRKRLPSGQLLGFTLEGDQRLLGETSLADLLELEVDVNASCGVRLWLDRVEDAQLDGDNAYIVRLSKDEFHTLTELLEEFRDPPYDLVDNPLVTAILNAVEQADHDHVCVDETME